MKSMLLDFESSAISTLFTNLTHMYSSMTIESEVSSIMDTSIYSGTLNWWCGGGRWMDVRVSVW